MLLYCLDEELWKLFDVEFFLKIMNGFKYIVRIGIVYNKLIVKISIKNDCIYDKMKIKNIFLYK